MARPPCLLPERLPVRFHPGPGWMPSGADFTPCGRLWQGRIATRRSPHRESDDPGRWASEIRPGEPCEETALVPDRQPVEARGPTVYPARHVGRPETDRGPRGSPAVRA